MTITVTRRFEKSLKRLPPHIQRKFREQLQRLVEAPHHPSLKLKKMRGTDDIWEARVDYQYRLVFSYMPDGMLLHDIGTHQIYERV